MQAHPKKHLPNGASNSSGLPIRAGRAHTRCEWGAGERGDHPHARRPGRAVPYCNGTAVAFKAASRRGASRRGLGRPRPVSLPTPYPCASARVDAFHTSRGGPWSATGLLTRAAPPRAILFAGG